MASYRVHDRVTVYSAGVLGALCYWAVYRYALPWGMGNISPGTTTLLLVGAYLFSGLLLSNDLDIDSRVYRRWGVLRLLWYPYQRLVAHRSVLSHGLIIGPLLRLLYLYVVLELLLIVTHRLALLAGYSTQMVEAGLRLSTHVLPYLVTHPQLSVPVLVGLVLGGVVHSLLDL